MCEVIYEIEWVEESLKRTRVEASTKEEALMWFYETDQYRVNEIATEVSGVTVKGESS